VRLRASLEETVASLVSMSSGPHLEDQSFGGGNPLGLAGTRPGGSISSPRACLSVLASCNVARIAQGPRLPFPAMPWRRIPGLDWDVKRRSSLASCRKS
jgi:hypothetical protein